MKLLFKYMVLVFVIMLQYEGFSQNSIEIKTKIKKEIKFKDNDYSLSDKEKCIKWELSDSLILKIFKVSRMVSGEFVNTYYYDYPCYYFTEVNYDGSIYKMKIMSSSYFVLWNKEESMYFIPREDDLIYFPFRPWDGEDEEQE